MTWLAGMWHNGGTDMVVECWKPRRPTLSGDLHFSSVDEMGLCTENSSHRRNRQMHGSDSRCVHFTSVLIMSRWKFPDPNIPAYTHLEIVDDRRYEGLQSCSACTHVSAQLLGYSELAWLSVPFDLA